MFHSSFPLSDVLKLILTSFLVLIGTNVIAQNTSSDISDIELVIQDGHSSDIIAMDTHPYLNQLATLDQSGELIIWDMNSRMLLEKHYLGVRSNHADEINFSGNGNSIIINTFRGEVSDLYKNSKTEIFYYNFYQKKKYNLNDQTDFSINSKGIFTSAVNHTIDYGYEFLTVNKSGIIKSSISDTSFIPLQKLYSERVIDVETDSLSGYTAITLESGLIDVLDKNFNTLWNNYQFDEPVNNKIHPVVRRTKIINGQYIAYFYNRNKGDYTKKDHYRLIIRELKTGKLITNFDFDQTSNSLYKPGISSSKSSRYIAAYQYLKLVVIDTQDFSVVYSESIPNISGFNSKGLYQKTKPIKAISFLENTRRLAVARENSLFIYDPLNNSFSTNFNTTLKPEYGGKVSAYGNNSYSIFNKRLGTLDLYSLQNLGQKSYNSGFFSELVESEKITYSTGKNFSLPTQCVNCNGYGSYLSFDNKNKTASFWVNDINQDKDHYVLTFDTEDWSLLNQTDAFDTEQTRYEKIRQLEHFDHKYSRVFITDSSYIDLDIGRISNLEIIDVNSQKTILTKRKISNLTFSDDGRYWFIRDGYDQFHIYSSETMEEIFSDSIYYERNSGFNHGFHFQFHKDFFYYTRYQKKTDGNFDSYLLKAKLNTGKKTKFLNLYGILATAFKLTEDSFYLGMGLDLTETSVMNKDSLETLIQVHGYDAISKDNITILDIETKDIKGVITGTPGMYETIEVLDDFIITKQVNNVINIYRKDNIENPVSHYKIGKSNLFTNGSFYTSSKDLLPKIGLRSKDKVFRVEEFDFFFNRPDTLIKQLGAFIPEELEAFKEAVAKRIRNSSLSEQALKRMLNFEQLPELVLTNLSDIEYSTTNNSVFLQLEANSSIPLQNWELTVNGIRILNNSEKIISGDSHSWSYDLPLTEGQNDIKILVKNEYDISSVPINLSINYKPEQEINKDLYIVTIGVSDYENDLYDLKYADKDAFDLQKAFAYKDTLWSYTYDWNNTDNRDENGSPAKIDSTVVYVSNKYFLQDEIYSSFNRLSITNEEVTDKIPSKVNSFLKDSDENDVVLIFLAGHGIIDNLGDYYFGTYDIDFENPSEKGIPYDGVLSFFDGIKSRNRILFMDTCQSGELDPEMKVESQLVDQINDTSRISTNLQRNVGSLSVLGEQKEYDSFKLMKETFSGFETDGTIVISASSATGFAYETNNVKNGVFTYSVMDALMNPRKVNTDYDAGISVSELQNYVFKNVELLTNGKQVPTLRQENIQNDFRVW